MDTIITKAFDQLSTTELYDLLQLRSEVFVVEQNCAYQDVDGKDQKALHVLGYKKDQLVAYTRAFGPGDYFEEASIGRVVVSQTERQHNYGYSIMEATISAIKTYFNTGTIALSAQTYLTQFYKNLGFQEEGEGYLEDGIPHVRMVKH